MIDQSELMARVSSTLSRAYRKHGYLQWGRHEFYAILKEEVDELWDVIKTDGTTEDLLSEMADVMAMCIRYYETGNRYGDNL